MESFAAENSGLAAGRGGASLAGAERSAKGEPLRNAERGPELRQRRPPSSGPKPHEAEGTRQKPAAYRTTADLRGRPAHDNCHIDGRPSLLSHRNRTINLRGFFNLLVILVFVHNFRLVLENFLKYGVRIKPRPPTSIKDLVENWPILLSLILMHISFTLAFFIEKFMNSAVLRTSRPSVLTRLGVSGETRGELAESSLLTWGNALAVVIVPYLTIRLYEKAEPSKWIVSRALEPTSSRTGLGASFLRAGAHGECVLPAVCSFGVAFAGVFHHVVSQIGVIPPRPLGCSVLVSVREGAVNGAFPGRWQALLLLGSGASARRKEPFSDTVIGGEEAMQYPNSLTFRHYYSFLVMPTMCFQNTFFPLQRLKEMTILKIFFHLSERILKLSIPNLYVWLLMFFALFHHWLNFLAEITRFADREFYLDWWNSSSFGEYWRKWNLPIHNFFNRHVNKPLLRKGVPRWVSNHIIFIISALAHEYMVCVPLHLGWTGLVFSSFIAQVPLIYLTSKTFVSLLTQNAGNGVHCPRTTAIRRGKEPEGGASAENPIRCVLAYLCLQFQQYPTAGNTIFWVLFCFTGQPLAIIIYYYLWGVKHGAVAEVDVQELQKLMTTAAHIQEAIAAKVS